MVLKPLYLVFSKCKFISYFFFWYQKQRYSNKIEKSEISKNCFSFSTVRRFRHFHWTFIRYHSISSLHSMKIKHRQFQIHVSRRFSSAFFGPANSYHNFALLNLNMKIYISSTFNIIIIRKISFKTTSITLWLMPSSSNCQDLSLP